MMMKRLAAWLLCGLLVLSFAACTDDADNGKTNPTEEEVVKDVDVQEIQNKIKTDLKLNEASVKAMSTKMLTRQLGISETSIAASASFYINDSVFDEQIFLIKATDTNGADEVEAKLQLHLDSLRTQAENYDPESKAILKDCEIIRKGNYVALFFASKRAEMEKIYNSFF